MFALYSEFQSAQVVEWSGCKPGKRSAKIQSMDTVRSYFEIPDFPIGF